MQDRQMLIAGVRNDFPPLASLQENEQLAEDELVGFEIAIVREFARQWLGDENAVEFVTVTSDNRFSKLENCEVDIVIASMSITQERDERIDFSRIYFESQQALLVNASFEGKITKFTDLDTMKVAAIRGSTSLDQIKAAAEAAGIELVIVPFRSYASAVTQLKLGVVDALTSDRVLLSYHAKLSTADASSLNHLALIDFTSLLPEEQSNEPFPMERYGIGVREGQGELQTQVNETLQAMHQTGTLDELYDELYAKLLDGEPRFVFDAATEGQEAPAAQEPSAESTGEQTTNPTAEPTAEPTATVPATPTATVPATATAMPTATPTATSPVTLTAAAPTTAMAEPPGPQSVIAAIRERGQLVAGVKVDARPFGFRQDGGFVGFEVDLMRELARLWLGDPNAVEFVPVTSSDRMEKLINGEIDIIAATMTHNKARDEFIDFSQTYFLDGQNILVRADSGIETIEDLRGKRIAAVEGSTSIDQIREFVLANNLFKEDGSDDLIEADIEIVEYGAYTQAINPLLQGDVDALTTDRGILIGIAQAAAEESADESNENPELVLLLQNNFSSEPYGLGVPTGDSYFANLVNFSLQTLKDEGTYDELYREWFGNEGTPYPIEILPGMWPYTLQDSPVSLDAEVESVVERILADGQLVAGVKYDAPLFGFRDDTGQISGFEIDLMREFARRWLGNADAVQFVPVTSSDRIEKLADGDIDIIAATMTHTQPRDELIDFSQTYYLDGQNILVREESGIEALSDLDGKIVAAVSDSTSLERMSEYADQNGIEIQIEEFETYSQAINPLLQGDVDALTTDRGILLGYAQNNEGLTVLLEENFSNEPYGLGVPDFDHRFRDLVNFTLQEMLADGTYAALYGQWFGIDSGLFNIEVWPGQNYLTDNLTPMVLVDAGEFTLGRETGDDVVAVEYDAKPARHINLDAYYIDQYEVTNRLYRQCVDAGECTEPERTGILRDPEYYYSDRFSNHPVIYITWNDAQNYCSFAGKALPTEFQWEKAARGPYSEASETIYLFPWGDSYDHDEPRASYNDNFLGFPREVGSYRFAPSGTSLVGAHDMSGNVREWTNTCYEQKLYETFENGASNPTASASCEADANRVVRGGGWNEEIFDLTTTRRQSVEPEETDRNLGFRCVSTDGPQSQFRSDLFAEPASP